MVLLMKSEVKKYLKSSGTGTWGRVEYADDDGVVLRASIIKVMESPVRLGFTPNRETDLSGRMFSPISQIRPFSVQTGMSVKITSTLVVDEAILTAFTGYRIGYFMGQVPGVSKSLGLMFREGVTLLTEDSLQIEVVAHALRRLTIEDNAEFARIHFVAIPVGMSPESVVSDEIVVTEDTVTDEAADDPFEVDTLAEDMENTPDDYTENSSHVVEDDVVFDFDSDCPDNVDIGESEDVE